MQLSNKLRALSTEIQHFWPLMLQLLMSCEQLSRALAYKWKSVKFLVFLCLFFFIGCGSGGKKERDRFLIFST